MKTKKAIEAIKFQIDKIDGLNQKNLNSWKTQTKTFLSTFFNEEEYLETVNHFYLRDMNSRISGVPNNSENDLKEGMKNFLSDCIHTLSIVGVYKAPKPNLFSGVKNYKIILVFISALSSSFLVGKYVGKLEPRIPASKSIISPPNPTNEVAPITKTTNNENN
ncbi:hypothetical protein [Tenacibaculum finnmarkense]|uniref:hypothetical protein n=1 Tax=Tenacibaculum finnmarkense TaxID=2781243 RepID=UPI00187BA3B6|nr:hypothetical protein [Tenacibaculum finnmarkense]MBE7646750.1 hypothetical protein [Tenacibaculum finnmarkense genomovar ulcerans]MCG8734774.1 hypothetical protein [Tenacibaculum finnmarkense]